MIRVKACVPQCRATKVTTVLISPASTVHHFHHYLSLSCPASSYVRSWASLSLVTSSEAFTVSGPAVPVPAARTASATAVTPEAPARTASASAAVATVRSPWAAPAAVATVRSPWAAPAAVATAPQTPPDSVLTSFRRRFSNSTRREPKSTGKGFLSHHSFRSLGVERWLCRRLQKVGLEHATTLQADAIPVVQNGGDAVLFGETGSGKTLAFGVSLLELAHHVRARCKHLEDRRVAGIVIAPTQELARQIGAVLGSIDDNASIHLAVGGAYPAPVGCEIVIGTPTGLLEMLESDACPSLHVRIVTLDECDMLLSKTFFREVVDIVAILRRGDSKPQFLFSAATMPFSTATTSGKWILDNFPEVRRVVSKRMHHAPKTLSYMWARIDEATLEDEAKAVRASGPGAFEALLTKARHEAMSQILKRHFENRFDAGQVLVFASNAWEAEIAAGVVEESGLSVRVGALHKNVPDSERCAIMDQFQSGALDVLVATDVAARGLDVENIDNVVQLAPPTDASALVHRVGRAGRRGLPGQISTIGTAKELDWVREKLASAAREEDAVSQRINSRRKARRLRLRSSRK